MKAVKRAAGAIVFWGIWPYWYLTLYRTNRARVLISSGDDILLTTPTLGTDRWTLPGGGIKPGEESAAAACRELREELGLELSPKQLQPLGIERIYESTGLTFLCHFYSVRLAERPALKPSIELVGCKWVPFSQVEKLPVQTLVRRAVALLRAR